MATFQVNKKNKKKTTRNIKLIFGWILLILSTLVFLFSSTKIVLPLQDFFLGVFGVFVYPLCVLGIFISLALLNNKKYVMPKAYAVFLSLSLFFFLSIVQLIVIGNPKGLNYGDYIALNYTKKFTACGILIGFIPTSFVKFMGLAATYVLLSLGLLTSIAFFIQELVSIKKTTVQQKPIKLQIKDTRSNEPTINSREDLPTSENKKVSLIKKQNIENNSTNIMFGAHQKEEMKKELSAREKLGLVGNYQSVSTEKNTLNTQTKKSIFDSTGPSIILPEVKESQDKVPKGMSIKEYLLSPPQVDIDKFMKTKPHQTDPSQYAIQRNSERVNNYDLNGVDHNIELNASTVEDNDTIQDNIEDVKVNDNIVLSDDSEPNIDLQEENANDIFSNETIAQQGDLINVNPDDITNEAEDIIRSVAMEEKREIQEELEDNSEYIDYNSIPDNNTLNRDNLDISNRDSFSRESLTRGNELLERNSSNNDSPLLDRNNGFNRGDNLLSRDNLLERDDKSRENLIRDTVAKVEEEKNQPLQNDNNNSEQTNGISSRFRPNDEMARRKKFVSLDDEKPAEKIIPYKYTRPSIDLIKTKSDDLSMINDNIPMKRVALENALESFGIAAKVQNVVVGPTVTRYEIAMPEGISVKKILNLDADIAYALSANGQIRIEAPIPGRSIVGIEVPNSKVAMVSIKDILQSQEFINSPSPLTCALGKDITGKVRIFNLQKMPHLLVAGTTNSGKSVCLNSIITSIIYKSSPEDVKFIMIDPKQVELTIYQGIPHLIVPRVLTDVEKAVNALQWAVDEMERRFKLISEAQVRNIAEYNKTTPVVEHKVKKMPYIIIIFDEFGDFMITNKNDIEDKIRRLAGKARAAGIHLILATQRPSTDIVTGTLKGNLPARIAFRVAARVDSEVILGSTGAEKLLGFGDMLFKPADAEPSRVQGCFIGTEETKEIVKFVAENNEEIFDEEINNAINNPNKVNTNGGHNENDADPLLPQALKICIDNGFASITMLQRKLSLGYPKAARIIDQLEERGYISGAEHSKQRSVYVTIEEFYSIFGDIYD